MNISLMERYVKLILHGFHLYNGEVYVSEPFLNYLGMPGTVQSLVSQSKKLKNGKWVGLRIQNYLFILLKSIPAPTQVRLKLDFPQDYLKDLLITHKGCDDEKVLDQVKAESYLIMQKEVANFKKYLPTFYEIYPTREEREMQAINFAILQVITSFLKKYPRGLTDYFYQVLKDEKIAKHSIPIKSKNYFYKYISRIIREGLPNALINGNRDKPSNNLKLNQTMKELIIYLKSYGNYTSCREIEDNIKQLSRREGTKDLITVVDETTIRNFLATHEADNLTLLARQGYRRFEDRILGYLPLNRTKDPLTKILIDGYVLQVVCEGDSAEPIKMVLFTIMDSYSGYVVADIGDVEDYRLIRRVFEKFLRFTEYKMPKEIISDAHASNQSRYFKSFKKYLKGNGARWTVSTNPRRKAQLERWFGTLQQVYLSRIPGYVGEGIKSKRKDAHPSEEVLVIIRKKEYLRDKNEFKKLILAAVQDYNVVSHFQNAAAPLDIYHLKKPVHYLQLQEYHIPFFFWEKHSITIHGSMIVLKAKEQGGASKEWFYRRAEYDFAKLNGEKVDVYQNADDPDFAYVFEKDTIHFISAVPLQLAANEAMMDQTDQDRTIIAQFGIGTKALTEAFTQRLDEIETNLKAKFGIDAEGLRSRAQFKKDADDDLAFQLGITKKTVEPDISKPYKHRRGRKAIKRASNNPKEKSKKANGIYDTMG